MIITDQESAQSHTKQNQPIDPTGETPMKTGKIILTIATLIITALIYSENVHAAPVQMPDGNIFDAEFYAQTYPDVVAVFGTDPGVLYYHYLTCGAAEGRQPYASAPVVTPSGTSSNFAEKQLQAFSALIVYNSAYENGRIIERNAGRTYLQYPGGHTIWSGSVSSYTDESYLFDANAYAMYNPDIAATYGSSKEALWNHYKTIGVYEGRMAAGTTADSNAKLMIIQIAQSITTPQMTDEEKIRAVHDWMCNYARYDRTYSSVSHTIAGFMNNHVAVCDGYARTFEYFMYVLDIPCETVAGGGHAWNRVALGGYWYYIDVTWDDPICGNGRDVVLYSYYLIPRSQMDKDHSMVYTYDYY